MRVEERLGLAHLAYERAVGFACEAPTPAAWRRLVTAAKNLRGAERDRESAGRGGAGARGPARGAGGRVVRWRWPLPRSLRERWPELDREYERARGLLARSRELVRESALLRAELAQLSAARCRAAPRRWSS
jgi:hypothetical protein